MPHWDFECDECGLVVDLAFPSHAAMKETEGTLACTSRAKGPVCPGTFQRLASRPSVVSVYGFNAANHYGAKQTETVTRKNGIKVITKEHTQPTTGRSEER